MLANIFCDYLAEQWTCSNLRFCLEQGQLIKYDNIKLSTFKTFLLLVCYLYINKIAQFQCLFQESLSWTVTVHDQLMAMNMEVPVILLLKK